MIQLSGERLTQIHYVGITEEDLVFLKGQSRAFEQIVDRLVDALYDHIVAQPHLLKIIRAHSTVDRLKQMQRGYYLSMTSGRIDEAYIENRLFIGRVHSRIGLTTDWYLGTYLKYLDLSAVYLKESTDEWQPVIHALTKMFNLDSQLVLEAYEEDEKNKIRGLAESQKKLLEGVGSAVQQLASMMGTLEGSSRKMSQSARLSADHHAESFKRLEGLSGEVEQVRSVGTVMDDFSSQTHLLGINAAIEAAHAGEQGRGFGIVASEVRKLAVKSKDALRLIDDRLKVMFRSLDEVRGSSLENARYAEEQVLAAQELDAFVATIARLSKELEELQHKN